MTNKKQRSLDEICKELLYYNKDVNDGEFYYQGEITDLHSTIEMFGDISEATAIKDFYKPEYEKYLEVVLDCIAMEASIDEYENSQNTWQWYQSMIGDQTKINGHLREWWLRDFEQTIYNLLAIGQIDPKIELSSMNTLLKIIVQNNITKPLQYLFTTGYSKDPLIQKAIFEVI